MNIRRNGDTTAVTCSILKSALTLSWSSRDSISNALIRGWARDGAIDRIQRFMGSPPAPVVHFTRTHLRSIEDLQVFVACFDNRERWWDSIAMAREVGVAESVARKALDRLARGNLLDIRLTGDVRYRFGPGTQELDTQAAAFAAAYRKNPVDVVRLIVRSLPNSLRDFADAFRIKPDDDR